MASSSGTAWGSRRRCISKPMSSATRRVPSAPESPGRSARARLAACLLVTLGERMEGVGVPAGVEPQLVLQEHPHACRVGGRGHEVAPQRTDPVLEIGVCFEVRSDGFCGGVAPLVEEGEQQPVFAPEVVVDGAGGPIGFFGQCVDRGAGHPAVGDEVGGRFEEAPASLVATFGLRSGHRGGFIRLSR